MKATRKNELCSQDRSIKSFLSKLELAKFVIVLLVDFTLTEYNYIILTFFVKVYFNKTFYIIKIFFYCDHTYKHTTNFKSF